MNIMQVEVVSNEQNIYSGEAIFVVVPTVQDELGTYLQHEPIMNLMCPGALHLTVPDQTEEMLVAVSGGLLEIQPERIIILADVAVRNGEADQTRAKEARKMIEAGISQAQDDESLARTQITLAAAIAQPKTLNYLRP